MKHFVLIGLLFFVFTSSYKAQDQDYYLAQFEQANAAYDTSNYSIAIAHYEEIVQAGYLSPKVFFNLGNAHYKMGNIPAAILYYEKTLKLNPGDADAEFNLKLANQQIIDEIATLPELFYVRWWKSIRNTFSINGWAGLSVGLAFLLAGALFGFLKFRKTALRRLSLYVFFGAFPALIFSLFMAYDLYTVRTGADQGIVFSPTVNVQSEPSEKGTALYVIHEGLKVNLLESKQQWVKVSLPDGSIGWIKKHDIETI